jgi:hypothetical protein
VKNAASIVERRPTTHQLRIGVARLEVAVQAAAPGKR